MADWRRRSIAGGPSPATDIPGDLHLDFFYRPSAARIAFPRDGARGTRELETAILPTRPSTEPATDEAFLLPAAHSESKMAVASPATTDEASPSQPRQCQPVGTAASGGRGSRRRLSLGPDDSGGRVSCPSSPQLPPLTDHAAISFVNDEAGEGDDEDAVSHNDGDEQDMSAERSEGGDGDMPSGGGEGDDVAMSSERGEEDDEDDEEGEEDEDGEDVKNDEDGEDDEEEEEPQVPAMCVKCGSIEELVMLLPCRHSCYCRTHYNEARWQYGPGLHCPGCGLKCERGHPQSARLQPKPK